MTIIINVTPLSKIPKFRLIGNKYSILNYISEVIIKEKIEGKIFFDVFSGSGCVGRYFKQNYSIISNDILYFSYVLQKTLITLNNLPKFENVKIPNLSADPEKRINQVLEFLNSLKGRCGFIYSHYTPASKDIDAVERKYFSEENGRRIDAIRMTIDEWFSEKQINEDEYFYLLASLLLAVQKVSNISGTYGSFNKTWDPRAKKPLTLKPIEIIPSNFTHKAFNSDVFNILDKVFCDIAYIDPPYNSRQYIANYHILETIARYDNPKISGKTGIRQYSQKEKSAFCSKKTVSNAMLKLLNSIKAKYIILSYSSDGLISKDEIISLFEKAGLHNVKLYEFKYRRFKSNKNTHKNLVKEYIFVGRKE
jgi:adenine-specific DNA-methyltransferase